MQHDGNATPARRQDRRCGDVAAGGEHHIDRVPADHPPHAHAGEQQPQQLQQLGEPAPLQSAGVHAHQTKAFRHQLRFEPIGHSQPAHGPLLFNGFRNSQSGEEMAAGAAGGDQKPGHRVGRHRITAA